MVSTSSLSLSSISLYCTKFSLASNIYASIFFNLCAYLFSSCSSNSSSLAMLAFNELNPSSTTSLLTSTFLFLQFIYYFLRLTFSYSSSMRTLCSSICGVSLIFCSSCLSLNSLLISFNSAVRVFICSS